jgi:hypothetical protein
VLERQVRRMLKIRGPNRWRQFRRAMAEPARHAGVGRRRSSTRFRRSAPAGHAEVELLFDSIVREDRNVVDLLTADYVRQRAPGGIHPAHHGSQFRCHARTGQVAGRAVSVKARSSRRPQRERTSPVTRGKWVMANIRPADPAGRAAAAAAGRHW